MGPRRRLAAVTDRALRTARREGQLLPTHRRRERQPPQSPAAMTVKRWWLDGRAPWGRGLGRKGKLDHGLHRTQRARTHACNPYPSAPWSPWCNTLGVRIADERGIALIGVVVLSALLLTLAVALALNVTSDTQLRGALGSGVTGFYAAESGLNLGLEEYRIMLLADRPPGEADFAERSFTLGDRRSPTSSRRRAASRAALRCRPASCSPASTHSSRATRSDRKPPTTPAHRKRPS